MDTERKIKLLEAVYLAGMRLRATGPTDYQFAEMMMLFDASLEGYKDFETEESLDGGEPTVVEKDVLNKVSQEYTETQIDILKKGLAKAKGNTIEKAMQVNLCQCCYCRSTRGFG